MTDDATADSGPAARPGLVFWIVAGVAMLWNAFGGYDYTMSHLQGEPYYRQMGMTDEMIAYMGTYPSWMHAIWAIGVWGSVAGSVLLLLRSRWATHAFGVSILGAIGSLGYTFASPDGVRLFGLMMPGIIIAICAGLIWYSQRMAKAGVLR
jgi:hypothetical protein